MKNCCKFVFLSVLFAVFVGGCVKDVPQLNTAPESASLKVEKPDLATVWSFNDGKGKLVRSDNNIDKPFSIGMRNRSPLWSGGVNGKALCFLGRGSAHGEAPDHFNLEEPFTIDFFVKMMNPSLGANGGLYDQMIYRKAGFRIMVSRSGVVSWRIQNTSESETFSVKGPKLELGKWHHLAFVNDNEKLSIYLDGKLSVIRKFNGKIKQTATDEKGKIVSANKIILGHTGGKNLNFNGSIDQLRLSNFARNVFSSELEMLEKHKSLEAASRLKIKEKPANSDLSKRNLLENGSFESDLTLWDCKLWGLQKGVSPTDTGGVKIVKDEKSDGKKAVCFDRVPLIAFTAQLVSVKQGETYTFSADIKTDNPDTQLYMRAYSPRVSFVNVKTKKFVKPSSSWKRYSFTFKIPENWSDRLSCDFFVSKSPGKIWIDRVAILPGNTKEIAKNQILMSLTSTKTANVFWKGEKVRVKLDLINCPDEKGKIFFKVMDINNEVVLKRILPVKSQLIDLPLGLGLYSLHANYSSKETESVSVSSRMAVFPKKENSKFFGVQYTTYIYWLPHYIIENDFKLMKLWGVKTVRTGLKNRKVMMELNPDSHTMHFFKSAYKHNYSVLCTLGNYITGRKHAFNLKEEDPEADFVTDEDLVHWEKSVGNALKHLDSYIDYVEVLNEPNCLRSPAGKRISGGEYMNIVEKTYKVARQYAPSVKVVAGSVTGLVLSRFQFFEEMLREDRNRKFFDALSFHPYAPANEDDVYKGVLSLRKVIDQFTPGVPLLSTELGMCRYENAADGVKAGWAGGCSGGASTANCFTNCAVTNGERIQCRQIIKNLIACKALGVKVFLHHIWGSPTWGATMDMQGNGGLLAGAYGFLSRFLNGVDSLELIDMGEALRTFAFKLPDGSAGVFIWTFGEGSKARIKLKTKPENIVIRDITGCRQKAVAKSAESVTVQLSHMPRLIIARNFSTDILKKCLKNADLTGFKGTVTAHISILSPDQIKINLKSKTNKKQSLSDAKLLLSNNQRQQIIQLKDMEVRPDKYLILNIPLKNKLSQGLTSITLSAKLDGKIDFSCKKNLRLVNCYKVKDVKADSKLDEWGHFTPIQLGEDNLKKYAGPWNGPEDHNAKLWLGYDEKNFYIAAEVSDDKHINTGGIPYLGDSFQIYFDPLCDSQQAPDRDVDDFEFSLCLSDKKMIFHRDKTAQFELSGLRGTGEIPASMVKRSIVRKGNKTIYEIIIPKSQLTPVEFGNGKSLRFSLIINDNDKTLLSGEKKMKKRDSGLSLTGKGSEPYRNHKNWSEVLFIGK